MSARIEKIIAAFNQLALRLRLLVTLAIAMLLWLLVDMLLTAPTDRQLAQYQAQMQQLNGQIQETLNTQTQLNRSVSQQHHNPQQQRLDALKAEVAQIQQRLAERTLNLVNPNEMAAVLKSILRESKQLKLVSLNKMAPQPLVLNQTTPSSNAQTETDVAMTSKTPATDSTQSVQLYRHRVELVLQGSFTDTQAFLVKLEALPKQLAFERLKLTVEQYPEAEITLTVSTLGFDRKWIGG